MSSKIERIAKAISLWKSGDITQDQCLEIAEKIVFEKKEENNTLNIKESRKHHSWSPAETEKLKEMVNAGKSYKQIARELKRSFHAVRVKSSKMQLKNEKRAIRHWQPIEEKMAKNLGRTLKSVQMKFYNLRAKSNASRS